MQAAFIEEFDEGEGPSSSGHSAPNAPISVAKRSLDAVSTKTRTGDDGTIYEFDENLRAWFPKVDENIYNAYMNTYGDEGSRIEEAEQKYREAQEGANFREQKKRNNEELEEELVQNTSVYFEDMPPDVTSEEVVEFFSRRCGVIAIDHKGQSRVKLYTGENGKPDGTGICIFHRVESVQLALDLLDGTIIRDGCKVKVSKAEFKQQKTVKRKKAKTKSARDEKAKGADKLLDWTERDCVFKTKQALCTVVLKRMFDPAEFEKDAGMIYDLKEEIRPEFERIGDISKLIVFDRHPEGVVSVTYREEKHARQCIKKMNGRLFDGKRLIARQWDGVTKFNVEESKEEAAARVAKFESDLNK